VVIGALPDSSSEDSSLELGFDFAAAFAFAAAGLGRAAFVRAGALAADFVGTGLAGASSEDSSDSSSLDSSLELDFAAAVALGGDAFGVGAFPEGDLGCVALDAALPSAALALVCPGLGGGADGSSESESEPSELSSFWLTTGLETLVGAAFDGAVFACEALGANFGDFSSESLSLDSEDESVFGGGTLDFCSRVKQCQFISPRSCALFHWSQEV
jgi:hypothetical protein